MMTVNVEAIREWVRALESGDYEQTTGILTSVNPSAQQAVAHCCLGVACELFGSLVGLDTDDVLGNLTSSNRGSRLYAWYSAEKNQHMTRSALPVPVINYLGLPPVCADDTDESGDINVNVPDIGITTLADLNDNHGYTFPMIAQVLRDNFLTGSENANG
jgi:hypothetical protein